MHLVYWSFLHTNGQDTYCICISCISFACSDVLYLYIICVLSQRRRLDWMISISIIMLNSPDFMALFGLYGLFQSFSHCQSSIYIYHIIYIYIYHIIYIYIYIYIYSVIVNQAGCHTWYDLARFGAIWFPGEIPRELSPFCFSFCFFLFFFFSFLSTYSPRPPFEAINSRSSCKEPTLVHSRSSCKYQSASPAAWRSQLSKTMRVRGKFVTGALLVEALCD